MSTNSKKIENQNNKNYQMERGVHPTVPMVSVHNGHTLRVVKRNLPMMGRTGTPPITLPMMMYVIV